eukprot:353003-Chlamydomonas_euryale.AAC.4
MLNTRAPQNDPAQIAGASGASDEQLAAAAAAAAEPTVMSLNGTALMNLEVWTWRLCGRYARCHTGCCTCRCWHEGASTPLLVWTNAHGYQHGKGAGLFGCLDGGGCGGM